MVSRLAAFLCAALAASAPAFAQTRLAPVPVEVGGVSGVSGASAQGVTAGALLTGPSALPSSIGRAPLQAPHARVSPMRGPSSLGAVPRGLSVQPAAPAFARSQVLAGAVNPEPAAAGAVVARTVAAPSTAERKPWTDGLLRMIAGRPALSGRGFDGAGREAAWLEPAISMKRWGPSPKGTVPGTGAAESDGPARARPVPSPAGGGGGGAKGPLARLKDWVPPPGERLAILAVAPLWNAFVIGAAYLINPIRLAFLQLDFGLTGVAASYVASGVGLGIGFWLYKKLTHLPRAKIVAISTVALGAALVGWWGVAALLAAKPAIAAWTLTTPWFATPALGKMFSFAFNLFGDVFAMMSVTVSATYLVDVFRGERAKKYFPVIFGAGSLGGLAGSLFVLNFVKAIGPLPIMLISASIYLATLGALAYLERWSKTHPAEPEPAPKPNETTEAPRLFLAGTLARWPFLRRVEDVLPDVVKHVLSDRLLMLLFVLKLLERIVPDFANFLFESEMRAMFPGAAYRDAAAEFRALFAVWQQSVSFLTGMVLSTVLIKKIGVGWAAATSPIANAVGAAAYVLAPGMPAAYGLNQVEGGLRYVVMKPAVERGWAQVPKRIVYVVKPFLDSFTYRGLGKIISGIALLVLGPKVLGLGAATIAGLAIPLALVAAWNALKFGSVVQEREATREAGAAAPNRQG
ncbi:MAG: hypothetical protein HY553_05715 [Elusimicrobia bacterium]|nr:hypothetical protein [Elusimicrobiota bacterium]